MGVQSRGGGRGGAARRRCGLRRAGVWCARKDLRDGRVRGIPQAKARDAALDGKPHAICVGRRLLATLSTLRRAQLPKNDLIRVDRIGAEPNVK